MDSERSTGKKDGSWFLWRVFKEYMKQNIFMAVLGKVHSHSVVICRLTKKSMVWKKIHEGEKLIQTLIFPKLLSASAYEALIRRNVM